MSKEFLSEPINVKPLHAPETPFLRARQEWDDRIGSVVARSKNWRLAFIISSLIALILSVALLQQSSQPRAVPVIVGIDRDRGEPVVFGRVSDVQYQPNLIEIKYFLTHVISLVRNVPSDPVLIRRNWLKAYLFFKREAANQLNDITNKDEESPLKRIGLQTVTVKPVSIVQVDKSSSYQARWIETIYDDRGTQVDTYVMNGVFTIELQPPTEEKILNENPLGLYIRNFQWNKELK
jgi:type IV secretory pathway TrbF-like protein